MLRPLQGHHQRGIYRGMQVQQYLSMMHVFDMIIYYWLCSLLDQVLSLFVRIMPMVGLSSVPWTTWLLVFVKCHWSLHIIAVFLMMLKSSVKFLRSAFGGISCRHRNTILFMCMFLFTCCFLLWHVRGFYVADCFCWQWRVLTYLKPVIPLIFEYFGNV